MGRRGIEKGDGGKYHGRFFRAKVWEGGVELWDTIRRHCTTSCDALVNLRLSMVRDIVARAT